MSQVVIIGGGHAAAEATTALRQKGWQGNIVLISAEPHLPYQRPPLSKAYFNGTLKEEALAIKRQSVYDKCGAQLLLGKTVVSIDRQAKLVLLDDDQQVAYQYLIIATGTRARKLTIPGVEQAPLNYLRTLDDVNAIKAGLEHGTRLLIVGAGYIGLEIAASAVKSGKQVTVLEASDRVLARVTSPPMSNFYQDLHRQAGVDLRLAAFLRSFSQDSVGQHYAHLDTGETIPFDHAIVGIGVLPNQELAEDAGLTFENGIVVNEFTQTHDDNIFAIGDCSNHPNAFYRRRLRLESVPNAVEQAKTTAAVICGCPKPYDALPWFWSDQYDVKLQTAGLLEGYDDYVIRGDLEKHTFSIFYLKDTRLIAVDAVNSPQDFMKAKQLIPTSITIDKHVLADTTAHWFE